VASPSTLKAIQGMLAGDGLDNTFVNNFFATTFATNIITKAQTAISDASGIGVDISDLGNDIFPGVVGNVPSTYASIGSVSSLRTSYYNYARALFASGDIGGFAQFFGMAFGYAEQCESIMKEITAKASTSLTDYGGAAKKQSDLVTGGLTGLLTVSSNENLGKLGDDFVNFGTLFDYKDLSLFGTARGLAKQIQESRLNIAESLDTLIDDLNLNQTIDYSDPIYEEIFIEVLDAINITDEFYEAFEYTKNTKLRTLYDLLQPEKALTNSSGVVSFNSFTEVADSLSGFDQLKITSSKDFGSFLKTLETPGTLTNFDSQEDPISSNLSTDMLAQLGTGAGAYGQPNLYDIMGPVIGYEIEDLLTATASALATIQSSSTGTSIIQGYENISSVVADVSGGPYIVSGLGAGSYVTKALAIAGIVTALDTHFTTLRGFPGSADLRSACQTVYNNWNTIAKQVSDSKALLVKAGIDTSNFSSDKNSILGFANRLESLGADTKQLGTRDIMLALIESNITGDAIKASLKTGQNNVQLRAKGLISKALI
jgi:hypothetical protein